MTAYHHIPVLLRESVEGLRIAPAGVYVDATVGGGGHSRAILTRLNAEGQLYGFDRDADVESCLPTDDARFVFVRSNFRYLYHCLRYYGVAGCVDGLLADLGVSSHHIDAPERGFSFRFDGQLDMRMNTRGGATAADVVNTYSEERLADVFYLYGELKTARALASAVVRARTQKRIKTADELSEALSPFASKGRENKFLAQAFQALRIEVNDELGALKELLRHTLWVLKPGARLAIITYHSLEDRLVKMFLKTGRFEGKEEEDLYGHKPSPFRLINKKVCTPSEVELRDNPRSRSAKLRIAERFINEANQA